MSENDTHTESYRVEQGKEPSPATHDASHLTLGVMQRGPIGHEANPKLGGDMEPGTGDADRALAKGEQARGTDTPDQR